MNNLKKFCQNLLDIVYPPLCLHCFTCLEKEGFFCPSCQTILTLIETKGRCSVCFSEDLLGAAKVCGACQKNPSFISHRAAALDYEGPAASLVKHFKYGGQTYLAEGAAAYLATQLIALEWPFPDLIIPVPISLSRHWMRGYNQSALLAKELSKILQRPYCESLGRKSGDYSQAGLNYTQRCSLSRETFSLKLHEQLEDKIILLIDDVLTTGSTLRQCGEVLMEASPRKIYGLTLCYSLQ